MKNQKIENISALNIPKKTIDVCERYKYSKISFFLHASFTDRSSFLWHSGVAGNEKDTKTLH